MVLPWPSTQIAGRGSRQNEPSVHRPLTLLWDFLVPVAFPLMLLVLLTAAFRASDADVAICRIFYNGHLGQWPFSHSTISRLLYAFGTLPGIALGVSGLALSLGSLVWKRLVPFRETGFFLAALLVLGPGLLVNGVLKPYWYRPRPHQTAAFGGQQEFVQVWERGFSARSKSFPCGHASMGFYLMAPAFVLYRRHRAWAIGFAGLGITAGLAIGLARITQGAHFPSDVLWSGGMVYLSGLVLWGLFNLGKPARGSTAHLCHRDGRKRGN
jgi:membrane-associated PAP2 superfamily phosphatase